jgi:hypothetical protein
MKEVSALKTQLQELQSAVYTVMPADDDHKFICYFDLDQQCMGYTVTDKNMVELKLLSDMPAEILIAFGKFVDILETWQRTSDMDFPFAQYSGENADINPVRSQFQYIPKDGDLDGDEAKLT